MCLLIIGFCIIAMDSVYGCNGSCLTIGIIANGTGEVTNEIFSRHGRTISIVSHFIDTSEMYQILRVVNTLDADAVTDVIVLFDNNPVIQVMPQLLKTNNINLIKWQNSRRTNSQNNEYKRTTLGDSCEVTTMPTRIDDVHCKLDYNASVVDRHGILLGQQAIHSLRQTLSWKSIIIFYDTNSEIEMSLFVEVLSRDGVLLSMFNMDHVIDLHMLMYNIYRSRLSDQKYVDIVLLCRFACVRTVLRTANVFDSTSHRNTLLKKFSSWLVILHGHNQIMVRALRTCAYDLDNVAIIAIPEYNGNGTKMSLPQQASIAPGEAFYEGLESILLDVVKDEITRSNFSSKQNIIHKLEKRAASWNPVSKCHGYYIYTLLWTERGRAFSSVGYVEINGKVAINSDIFPNSKYGYNKREFLVSTLPYSPFVVKRMFNNTVVYEGFCMDILTELAHILNFTYRITEPKDRNWGSYASKDNLTFNGLIGQLQREEVDLVVAPISIQAERINVMDFSYPYYYEFTSVLTKMPNANAIKWRTLIDPFKWEVHVAIGIALLMVTILTVHLEKHNPYYDVPEHNLERQQYGGQHIWHSAFWFMFGALLTQGGQHTPGSTAGRTLVSSWWLFCTVIVGIYCGNLIAFLTVTKEKPPFNTLAEMVQLKGTYTWGILGGTFWEMAFQTSSNPTFRAIGSGYREFNRTDHETLSKNPKIHIRKVKQGNYAWIVDKTTIEVSMATECSLISIKEEFMPLRYAFGFTKNSPHTAVFSEQMINIHEGGLIPIWKRKWWPKADFCARKTLTEAKPISLMDVQSAFYVCLIGIVLGSVAFIMELILHRFRKYKRNAGAIIDLNEVVIGSNSTGV